MMIQLFHGDNRNVLRKLVNDGVRVHSCVTDPPYGLVSITKRFGANNAAPAQFGQDGAFARRSARFVGSKWDATGIERDPEFWRLIHDILLPGGFCLAFSSARTGHWQACAMEQAGFVMHPFTAWLYGSGMPVGHDAARAIDKTLGAKGEKDSNGYVPASTEAQPWAGWDYGAQSLKPAIEPIYVGQKPFSEKTGALNLLKNGVGAMNIEGCRVEGGNHPANLLHDGSDNVVAIFPNDAARFFNTFAPMYHPKASKECRAGSLHPTIKPVPLMQWLCRLVTPPGGVVLDPFAGSGTTGQAATNEGFDAILIEAEDQYAEDIRRRFNPTPDAALLFALIA